MEEAGAGSLGDLEVADVLEDKGVVNIDSLANFVVHGVDVGLVHGHALLGQGRGVVDRDVMELRMVLPVLVWRKAFNRKQEMTRQSILQTFKKKNIPTSHTSTVTVK